MRLRLAPSERCRPISLRRPALIEMIIVGHADAAHQQGDGSDAREQGRERLIRQHSGRPAFEGRDTFRPKLKRRTKTKPTLAVPSCHGMVSITPT